MACVDGYCFELIEPVQFSFIGLGLAILGALLYVWWCKRTGKYSYFSY